MKKLRFLPALFLATVCTFTACKDDEKKENVYSDLTIEENKKEIENEAVSLVSTMGEVTDLQIYDVISKLSSNMENSSFMEEEGVVAGINIVINEIESVKSAPKTTLQLKSVAMEDEDSPSTLFAENSGIYTWNGEDWDKEESATELTFKFNVEEQPAVVSISKFEFIATSSQVEDITNLELPTNIKMNVTLTGVELCSFSLEGKYSSDDMPESLVEKITLEGFTHESSLKINQGSSIKSDMSFDYNGTMIYANGVEVNGDITVEDIEGTGDPMEGVDILENANVYFQLGNIKADASADFVGMLNDMEKAGKSMDEEMTEDALNAIMIDIYNNNIKAFIRYADSKEVIAKSEFYLKTIVDDFYGDTYTSMDIKMVFEDGTSIDDSFFGEGFADFITEANDMIKELNENYDLELDLIE
ncbi:hypothetical protein [Labilibacter marinus]|uniref:hypothetical protein n=1 Tax=Labilibacter marinus TaxID=1477105 RepID=UPI0008303B2E|nr:hypothetical protein [Labilibacter marinus]